MLRLTARTDVRTFGLMTSMPDSFEEHNAEQKAVWDAFHAGRPIRVPVTIGCNPRMILLDPALNTRDVTFQQYMNDPDLMLEVMIDFLYWQRHELRFDQEMGLPSDGWRVSIDLQNVYEAAWFGAPVHYPENNCPYASPLLKDDNRDMLFDRGVPDPFEDDGVMALNWRIYDRWRERQDSGEEFRGRPILDIIPAATGTDLLQLHQLRTERWSGRERIDSR